MVRSDRRIAQHSLTGKGSQLVAQRGQVDFSVPRFTRFLLGHHPLGWLPRGVSLHPHGAPDRSARPFPLLRSAPQTSTLTEGCDEAAADQHPPADWSGAGDTGRRWRARLRSVELNLALFINKVLVGTLSATAPASRVVLSVKVGNDHAVSLYPRHGFVEVGPSPDDPGQRLMRRR